MIFGNEQDLIDLQLSNFSIQKLCTWYGKGLHILGKQLYRKVSRNQMEELPFLVARTSLAFEDESVPSRSDLISYAIL